jgi:LmbE family N-acetylglucosaminyl deacetylase
MQIFSRPEADIYFPDPDRFPGGLEEALSKVTHLSVGAHADDIEVMSHDMICDCLADPANLVFGGVVVTDGAGATGAVTGAALAAIRREEQREAARRGGYGVQIQLAHPSEAVRRCGHPGVTADLYTLFSKCRPRVLHLHQPADKHDTHVAVLLRCLEALRRLPRERQPDRVLGIEVWRSLDWMVDEDKIALDSGREPELARKLLEAFPSQISHKRYDRATVGRRLANATYHEPRTPDRYTGITWSMDLTPLLEPTAPSVEAFIREHIRRFEEDTVQRIRRHT